jgi:ABC-type transporter Mla subunit MlaD
LNEHRQAVALITTLTGLLTKIQDLHAAGSLAVDAYNAIRTNIGNIISKANRIASGGDSAGEATEELAEISVETGELVGEVGVMAAG